MARRPGFLPRHRHLPPAVLSTSPHAGSRSAIPVSAECRRTGLCSPSQPSPIASHGRGTIPNKRPVLLPSPQRGKRQDTASSRIAPPHLCDAGLPAAVRRLIPKGDADHTCCSPPGASAHTCASPSEPGTPVAHAVVSTAHLALPERLRRQSQTAQLATVSVEILPQPLQVPQVWPSALRPIGSFSLYASAPPFSDRACPVANTQ